MTSRRKLLVGFGALVAGTTAATGTGAFSTVQAERSVTVEVAGDKSAYLAFAPNEDYEGDVNEYVSITDDGEGMIELTFDRLNQNAFTQFKDLFKITNNGTQDITLFVNADHNGEILANADAYEGRDMIGGGSLDGPLILRNESEDGIVGGNKHQTESGGVSLGTGETHLITVEFDTRINEFNGEATIQFVAE
ncbi:hypothetical protein [Natronocalculus amylovorans]|uniref:DUF1102 domain-containing protein n=1 Tax=Natronocalculus amylovorans TaxID=2917812 RepID=A0AAE3FV76_9EURY|nr:hypothetical protein [Natronocalculus amylovorans]MCL9815760.1 hypothetical protein [Natronocalculus amylovorans]